MAVFRLFLLAATVLAAAAPSWAAEVRWHEWNDASLAAARASGRSVYLFVGSELSELSRSTRREIFTRPETVAWLNENFFCIAVDADARPEVAAYAQHFINSARQLRGWPVHLWLTPDLQPYDGANYLPPTEEWGRPGFLKSARSALDAWAVDPARARAMAEEAIGLMQSFGPGPGGGVDRDARLARATAAWVAAADAKHGGFGSAPKHPEPELIRFLLPRGPEALSAALAAARAAVKGALRDPNDGGFFRRTIDAEWQEPYRQKLLVDQARIALALYEAADAAGDDTLRRAADGALRLAVGRMAGPAGQLAAALDETEPGGARKIGRASPAAEGFLIAALCRSGDPQLRSEGEARALNWAQRLETGGAGALTAGADTVTAADLLGLALGLRAAGRTSQSEQLVAAAVRTYFDPKAGLFMAAPAALPAGIAVRVPALADPFAVEALALLAGIRGAEEEALRRGLLHAIEYDDTPAGAVLLALASDTR